MLYTRARLFAALPARLDGEAPVAETSHREESRSGKGLLSRLLNRGLDVPRGRLSDAVSPPSMTGDSLKPIGTGIPREYRQGSGWQGLALGAILVSLCGLVVIPHDTMNRWLHGPTPIPIIAPDVLVVSADSRMRDAVAETVRSRHGYSLREARSVDAALESLQEDPGRIGFVVIDSNAQGGRRVSMATAACPNARVLFMSSRDPSQIASALITAGMK
jgi:hypothetical protein